MLMFEKLSLLFYNRYFFARNKKTKLEYLP